MGDNSQSADGVDRCPDCGSDAVTTKGVNVGGSVSVKTEWDYCLSCGWDNR